jgi:hypothetical protein
LVDSGWLESKPGLDQGRFQSPVAEERRNQILLWA